MEMKLDKFIEAARSGRIEMHFHPIHSNLVGFKYSRNTVYSGDWDELTCNARGIVFDTDTGEVLARPFRKFFNYSEMFNDGMPTALVKKLDGIEGCDPNFDMKSVKYVVNEKIDGSLGIAFCYGDEWIVKTGGSFESDQAIWAQEWFDKHVDTSSMDKEHTYCFEIMYDADPHPIHYDYEGLYLLGVIDNATGNEMEHSELAGLADLLGVNVARGMQFDSLDEAMVCARSAPSTMEGIVVTFENGFKMKVKGNEYLALQRAFHSIDEKSIVRALNFDKYGNWKVYAHLDEKQNYKPIDDTELDIPEEFPDMRKFKEFILYEAEAIYQFAGTIAAGLLTAGYSQKEMYSIASKYPVTAIIMRAVRKQDYKSEVIKEMRKKYGA